MQFTVLYVYWVTLSRHSAIALLKRLCGFRLIARQYWAVKKTRDGISEFQQKTQHTSSTWKDSCWKRIYICSRKCFTSNFGWKWRWILQHGTVKQREIYNLKSNYFLIINKHEYVICSWSVFCKVPFSAFVSWPNQFTLRRRQSTPLHVQPSLSPNLFVMSASQV